MVADVSKINQTKELVESIKKKFGNIDILFVNAGVISVEPVGMISEKVFDYQMDINFKGAVFTIESFLPIINNGGSIINLSSIAAFTGTPNISIYSASKAALNSYSRTAAIELANKKIRVNVVNPGPVNTPILSKTGLPEEQINYFRSANKNNIPLKREGESYEVAKLVSFLASDDASFITGAEFNIDGGLIINSWLF